MLSVLLLSFLSGCSNVVAMNVNAIAYDTWDYSATTYTIFYTVTENNCENDKPLTTGSVCSWWNAYENTLDTTTLPAVDNQQIIQTVLGEKPDTGGTGQQVWLAISLSNYNVTSDGEVLTHDAWDWCADTFGGTVDVILHPEYVGDSARMPGVICNPI